MAKSNWIILAFVWEKGETVDFSDSIVALTSKLIYVISKMNFYDLVLDASDSVF